MIRRATFVLAATLVLGPTVWGIDQKFLEPSIPTSPTLKALGGASTANATGFDALFINPASFADPTSELTLSSFEVTANLPLSGLSRILDNRNNWSNTNYLDSANPMVPLMNDLVTKTGLGAEFNWGLGWVGKNLGVGLNLGAKSRAKGSSLLGAVDTNDVTLQGIIGMGWPFDVGLGTLRLGGAVRPMQKVYSETTVSDLISAASNLNSLKVASGFGLGWDLGARWDYTQFKVALVIRDAGATVFSFKDYTLGTLSAGMFSSSGGTNTGDTLYRVPTVIALGGSWVPDVGSVAKLVQPSLDLDFQIPIKDEYTQPSLWTWTHVGAEAVFLQMLSVRGGLNQGYLTFGLGVKLFVFDFNLAVYADELGRYSGLDRRSGIAMQWAFRL